jgi:hypothetical protein
MKLVRYASLLLSLFILVTSTTVNAQLSNLYTDASTWENLQEGTIVYAKVLEAPPALYLSPDIAQGTRIDNTLRFGASLTVTERHLYLDRGSIIRVRVVNSAWSEIVFQPTRPSPYTGNYDPTYVETAFLRLMLPSEFSPITIGTNQHSADRLILVNREDRTITAFAGSQVQLRAPVRMGPTPSGDFRTYRKMPSSDMIGFPGVGVPVFFTGGYAFHASTWWAWDEIARGSGGSHGCINLPGDDWYLIQWYNQHVGVAEWLYRWDANLIYDPTDQNNWFTQIYDSPEWYQAVGSTRVIVVDTLYDVYNYPLSYRLGDLAQDASVRNWDEIVSSYLAVGDNWLLTHIDQDGSVRTETIAAGQSIAEIEGRDTISPYVMLPCNDVNSYSQPAYPGSSRTIGAVCRHLEVERNGSICTPERVDLEYFGLRTLCDGPIFDASPLEIRGELLEHENVHLVQFSNYFKTLVIGGVAADDLTPSSISWDQVSVIGVTELMAQYINVNSLLSEDYHFVLVRGDGNGGIIHVTRDASTQEAWNHLHYECGDPTGTDLDLDSLITSALYGDRDAYLALENICSLPPHRLIPDRWR